MTSSEHSAIVRRAAEIVAAEMRCLIEDALRLLQAGAEIANVSLDEIATAVIDQSIQFADPSSADDEGSVR